MAPRTALLAVLVAAIFAAACGGTTPTSPTTTNCTVPGNVTNLAATISGRTATFTWTANTNAGVPAPTDYVLTIGTSTGASNVLSIPLTGTTTYTWTSVAPGTYFARVQPRNACGAASSNEVMVVIS
jgi:hypothetical protein